MEDSTRVAISATISTDLRRRLSTFVLADEQSRSLDSIIEAALESFLATQRPVIRANGVDIAGIEFELELDGDTYEKLKRVGGERDAVIERAIQRYLDAPAKKVQLDLFMETAV